MHKRFKQLQALTIAEWRVLFLSMLLLPIIAVALQLKGFKWTQALLTNHLSKKPKSSTPEDEQLEVAQSMARMVSIAANHGPYRANCLKKALVTWWLLERRGIATELKIGVNKDAGDFKAHAWVEYRGNILIDSADVGERFSTFNTSQIRYD